MRSALLVRFAQSLWLAIAEDAKNTKSITTKSICRFYTKSGQNTLECSGTAQNQQKNSQRAIALLVNHCDGSVISRKAFPFTIGRELSKNLVLTNRQLTTTGSALTVQTDAWKCD
jgi:hypothetical protein